MSKTKCQTSEFQLIGQFIDFIIKDGYKVKYLRIATSQREYWIKPAKEIREQMQHRITPGMWIAVSGEKELSLKTGKVKLKADEIKPVTEVPSLPTESAMATPSVKGSEKATILVCQKSDCWKKGGQAICQTLAKGLCDRGLEDRVKIKLTGCLKQCKKGPNVVLMPDKARYSNVKTQQIPTLLEQHFPLVAQ